MNETPEPPTTSRPLFLLDYDGTLAEIVADPARAFAHPAAAGLLRALASRFPLYLITGRRIRDVAALLDAPDIPAIGVHGAEHGLLGGQVETVLEPAAAAALDRLRRRLPALPGLRIEDKGPAIALHYREAAPDAGETLAAWAQDLPDALEALWGKKVLELRPKGTDKGQIAKEVAETHPERTPVFIGDDTTDEDAFAALRGTGITVKVGPGETTARYRLPNVDAVISYLQSYLP